MEKYDDRIQKLEAELRKHRNLATELMKQGQFNAAYNAQKAADRAQNRIEKLMRMKASPEPRCATCAWYDGFSGACCNGDSDYAADFRMKDDKCSHWQSE